MSGVPISEVTAKDFIMVRAALVKRLGGANEALVWSRIEYRSSSAKHAHETADGQLWWAVSYPVLAEETGLSEQQARRAIDKLVEGGFLLAEHHHGSDRRLSYCPVIAHLSESTDGIPPVGIDSSIGRERQFQLSDSTDVPLIETSKTVETSTSARSAKIEALVSGLFEDAWKHWPRKESKKKAQDRFLALADPAMVARAIIAHGDAHVQHTPTQFVPHLTTWLNQERWSDPLPLPRPGAKVSTIDNARAAADILAARREQREGPLAVTR